MVIVDEAFNFRFEHVGLDKTVVVIVPPSYVEDVLGCTGSQEEQRVCVENSTDQLVAAALSKSEAWVQDNGRFYCRLHS
ncbi:hypothetical protein [Devosia ginsengisoli]|uniref:hypothetical protein n=1 Tax=Devosia ginsengisoli TaxID=400770 RepID=UPI0026EAB575|nr:hypothetical protein [Devosia ginsengisoli]MCR6672582.1 hypothetical protein [Devosia ginsengisoli]